MGGPSAAVERVTAGHVDPDRIANLMPFELELGDHHLARLTELDIRFAVGITHLCPAAPPVSHVGRPQPDYPHPLTTTRVTLSLTNRIAA